MAEHMEVGCQGSLNHLPESRRWDGLQTLGQRPDRTCEDTSSSRRSLGVSAAIPPLLPQPAKEPRHYLGWTPQGQT